MEKNPYPKSGINISDHISESLATIVLIKNTILFLFSVAYPDLGSGLDNLGFRINIPDTPRCCPANYCA
jgi:hypothetical protein